MIKEFKGEYGWLSNFASVKITLDGITYPSVEHAYMSAKSNDPEWKNFCSNPNNTAGQVKKHSKTIILKDGWDDIKLLVMEECLKQKFNQEPFKGLLLATGQQHIQEGNWWGDSFWGVDLRTNQGENHLGELIMKIRNVLVGNFS
jgi:ribA/ribD-fused uncharacterized protein